MKKNRLNSFAGAVLMTACFVVAAPTQAQESKVGLYAGYAFLKTDDGNLNGARISPEFHLNSFASIVADLSYEKGTASSTSTTIKTYLGGVRLHRGLGSFGVFVHALAGGAQTSASVNPFGGVTISVADTGLALDGGGGLEFKAGSRFKVRVGGDYIRRKLDNGVTANDIRATAGLVF